MGSQIPIAKDRSRTYWTPTMERYFVDLMLEHLHIGNRVGHTFNKQAWTDMLAVFNAKFGSQYDKDVLKTRYTNLWKQFNDVKTMLGQSGFSWDETRNMVVADDDHVWDSYLKAHPDARSFKTKAVQNFSDLCLIYGYTTADGRYSRSSHDIDIDDEVLGDGLGSVVSSNTERSRTDWTSSMDQFFTELLVQQGEKGNKLDNNSYTKESWTEMLTSFNTKFGPHHTKRVLRHRYKKLFKSYTDIMVLLKQDGFSWDEKELKVVANDDVWDSYLKAHPQARSYRTKAMPNYKDLESIFGSATINGSLSNNVDEDIGPKTGSERSRTYWTPPMDRYLIDLLLNHVNKGNKIGQTFIAQAWIDMVNSFNTNFRSKLDKDVLKNRYKHFKRQYNDINTLLKETGFSWDNEREMVVAEDNVWDAYIKVHHDARSYRVKTFASYHKLCVIYGEDNSEGRYSLLARTVALDVAPISSIATGNFDRDKVIGGGGFGLVYKGALSLPEGLTTAAFKRLDPQWGQGNTEFRKEIMMLSKYRHENLISLMYFCDEGDEMILVYEYASRGSLDNYLSDESLTWTNRLNICIGIARALDYLHDPMGTQKRVLHRDIKSSNVLLDDNWTVKVSDFGLSRIGPANQQQSYLISRAVGTPGYCDPMYWQMGFLTKESDVYSFGVVLFEVMCGKLCVQYAKDKPDEPNLIVHEWLKCYEEDRLDEIVFHSLKEQMEPSSLSTFSSIAYECLRIERKSRPTMGKIVRRLEFALEQQTNSGVLKDPESGGGATPQAEVAGGKLVHFEGSLGFTADDLLAATAEIIGKSTYGTVYKASLGDGDRVAVKRFEKLTKNQTEFEVEVNLLGKIRHRNLLAMRDYYLEPKGEKLLVFDFMPKGSLTSFLHARGPETPVDWPTRMRIAKGMGRGLLSLHTHHNMIHGNLTSNNVLLDENINPKIADFGLSRLFTAGTNSNVIVSARALGYGAPELSKLNNANTKTDVYNLGVIMLELLTGKSPGGVDLPQWVASIDKEEWSNEVFDLELMKDASLIGDELLNTLKLALNCVDPSPSARPEVQLVLQQLKEIRPETVTSSDDDGGVGPSTSE